LETKHIEGSIEKIWRGMKMEEMPFSLPFPTPPGGPKDAGP
jgi:hypothetical protein